MVNIYYKNNKQKLKYKSETYTKEIYDAQKEIDFLVLIKDKNYKSAEKINDFSSCIRKLNVILFIINIICEGMLPDLKLNATFYIIGIEAVNMTISNIMINKALKDNEKISEAIEILSHNVSVKERIIEKINATISNINKYLIEIEKRSNYNSKKIERDINYLTQIEIPTSYENGKIERVRTYE